MRNEDVTLRRDYRLIRFRLLLELPSKDLRSTLSHTNAVGEYYSCWY